MLRPVRAVSQRDVVKVSVFDDPSPQLLCRGGMCVNLMEVPVIGEHVCFCKADLTFPFSQISLYLPAHFGIIISELKLHIFY